MGRFGNDIQDLYLDIILGFSGLVIVFISMFSNNDYGIIFAFIGILIAVFSIIILGLFGLNKSISRRFSKNAKL